MSPPTVIPIDIGRQLFVDDFLIAEATLKRTFHLAQYYSASPVLKPDKPWEMKNPDHAAAMVFSDGVWYDPKDELFKMWYLVGESAATGYATSRDGIRWDKPLLDVRSGSNIVQPGGRDSNTVWLDLEEKDPARRFKMFRVVGAGGADAENGWNNWVMAIHFSPDGIHWGDPVAYESLMVGFFTIWRGQPADRHKPNNVVLGYSQDGWHWSRPDRRAFCPISDKQREWNVNNVQSAGGGFLVVGDELYFYVSGRTGRPGGNKTGTLTTGLATLRRDGFASMDANETGGTLATRPVRFRGTHMFVNVDDLPGELRVEVLNQAGEVVPRFTAEDCRVVTANKTLQSVRWQGVDDLSSLANQPVRFRFHQKNGKLYAFWVSSETSGASQGYVAAGGPGFSSNRDTGHASNQK